MLLYNSQRFPEMTQIPYHQIHHYNPPKYSGNHSQTLANCFVRFRVNGESREQRTWLDKTLYNSFIAYNASTQGDKAFCYATGEYTICTYKHPVLVKCIYRRMCEFRIFPLQKLLHISWIFFFIGFFN